MAGEIFISGDKRQLHIGRDCEIEVDAGVRFLRAGIVPPTIADVAAITGGDAPTEAEFNALAAKFNAVLAVLRNLGVLAS